MKTTPLLLALVLSASALPAAPLSFSYPELVKQLTDLERLAAPPAVGEVGALASSYDRASKYDADNDKYIAWDANLDGDGIIREEDGATVIAEITGPAVIWRMWSATVKDDGHVKIYLDGAAEPAVDLPFKKYFDRTAEPFTRQQLVYQTSAHGYNNYTPIPFQKSCKIVAEKGWGKYYQFNYTQFPKGTVLPTFKLPLSAEDLAALDRADKIFAAAGNDPAGERADAVTETKTLTVSAGGTASIAEVNGSGAITALKVKIENLPADLDARRTLLAQLTVSAAWDGAAAPAVWSQLPDFFGAAGGASPFKTLVSGLDADGQFYNFWYMPFGSGAKISVGNDSPLPVTMTWTVTRAPLTVSDAAKLNRFHAKWHRDAFLPKEPERAIDWTLLLTKGRGRYVGTQLHIWNPAGGWWGEGDEKFFVDGEKFPSTLGTGSEDYFGYAWCDWHYFTQGLHAQPMNEMNQGHVSNSRWHLADNIPFQQNFEGAIEKYFSEKGRMTLYSAVAFWYLSADGEDPYGPVPWSERAPMITGKIFRVPGAIEGEGMRILNQNRLPAGQQPMTDFDDVWSGYNQLCWRNVTPGDRLELEFKVEKAGRYRLLARFTKAWDYGIAQLDVDGAALGAPVDLFAPKVRLSDEIALGEVSLSAGAHTLGVTVGEKNKNSAPKRYFFGLDYLKLEPLP